MKPIPVSSVRSEIASSLVYKILPCWENLPPECRQELVTMLATIVVKQLPTHQEVQREVAHE
jgi:hypothetical protein